jgi:hypothetical protein
MQQASLTTPPSHATTHTHPNHHPQAVRGGFGAADSHPTEAQDGSICLSQPSHRVLNLCSVPPTPGGRSVLDTLRSTLFCVPVREEKPWMPGCSSTHPSMLTCKHRTAQNGENGGGAHPPPPPPRVSRRAGALGLDLEMESQPGARSYKVFPGFELFKAP